MNEIPFYDPRTFAEKVKDNFVSNHIPIFVSVLIGTISSIFILKNVFSNQYTGVEPIDLGINALFSVSAAFIITLILILGLLIFEAILFGFIDFIIGFIEIIKDFKNKYGLERILLTLLILWFIYDIFIKGKI